MTVHAPVRPLDRNDVVLVRFPFTDLSGVKLRPGLILAQSSGDDYILAFITSQTSTYDPSTECLLDPGHPEFLMSGLKAVSLVRLSKLATLQKGLIQRRLGTLGPGIADSVARCLRHVFSL